MSIRKFFSLAYRHRQSTWSYRYANRVLRAVALRIILHFCLWCFKLECIIHPIRKEASKHILVIEIGGMGDCLLFDPLFKRLKERWPQARIDVLTGCFEQMWAQMASVDNLMVFRPTKFKPPWAYARLFRTIYRQGYDIVAEGIAMVPKRGIYPMLTAYIMQASGAAVRIGRRNTGRLEALQPRRMDFIGHAEMVARKKQRLDLEANPYLTHTIRIPPPPGRKHHESAYIFEPLGVPFHRRPDEPGLLTEPQTDQWARDLLRQQWAATDDILIAMTVETTRRIKAWPLDCFAQIMEKGVQDQYKFVMLGLDKDRAGQISRLFTEDEVINLAGSTDLAEMTALIGQCDVFLSCDTGPSHIAQACGIPTVVLFGPSNEKEFGPADTHRHTLVLPPEAFRCRPCVLGPCVRGNSCVNLIKPETVYQAMQEAVARARNQRHNRRPAQRKQAQRHLCVI